MKYNLLLLLMVPMLYACGTNSKSYPDPWNEASQTYTIFDEELKYTIPTNVDNWIIADPKNYPDNMSFFGIDSENSTCVSIIKPPAPQSGVLMGYTPLEITEILNDITKQTGGGEIISSNQDFKPSIYMKSDAWKFNVNISMVVPLRENIESPQDTMSIVFSGYIFEGKNNPCVIVITTPCEIIDSLGSDILTPYLEALHYTI